MLVLSCILLGTTLALAQPKISGKVVSSEDGQPVAGAVIIVQGADNLKGTITDASGNFTLEKVAAGTQLQVSFIGMKTQEVKAANGMVVTLDPDSKLLKEVVVTAYGTSTKGTFTGSVSSVSSETLENRQVSDVTNALAGTMAGVQVLNSNGQPGTGSTIRIRGIGSINASSAPLYIVDGMPFDGEMSSINSQDIESITVAKDAATTSLYGARGANGVIIVQTKKGKAGKAVVNLDARMGINSRAVKNYNVLTSPYEYTELAYAAIYNQLLATYDANTAQAFANGPIYGGLDSSGKDIGITGITAGYGYPIFSIPEGQYLVGSNGRINPNATLGYNDGTYYYTPDDWTANTFSNQVRQEYNASVSAGGDRYSFYASAGYLDDKGVITNSGFRRESFRMKADYKVKDWLKIGGNLAYSHSFSQYPDEQTNTTSSGNAFYIANYIAPVYPIFVRNADGSIALSNGRKMYDYGDGVSAGYSRSFMSIANPAGDLIYNKDEYNMDIFSLNGFVEIRPFQGLTITGNVGADLDFTRYNHLGNAYFGQSASYGGTAYQNFSLTRGIDAQLIANYEVELAPMKKLDFTAGIDSYALNSYSVTASGQNLYNPESFYVSNSIDQKNGYGSASEYKTFGAFARANYSLMDKYILSVGFREDGSSRFAPDKRWGSFLSGSAAWVLSSEEFMDNYPWVNLLKLKASYGQQGNDNIGNYYAYLDQYSVTGADGLFSDSVLSYKGNPDLTWEKSISYNVGVDFSLYDDRLSGSLEYFGRQSDDMLYYKPTPLASGYSSIPMNVGSMSNYGVELELNMDVIRSKYMNLSLFTNATNVNNKIIKLHEDLEGKWIDGSYIYEEGYSRYRMYIVEWAGVDKETGAPLFYAVDSKTGERYATTNYTKASETGRIATKSLLPKVYGGFGANISFFNFDASASLSYQLGGLIYDSGYARLMHSGYKYYMGNNWHTDIRNAWTPENKDSDIPRINAADQYSNSTSTRFLTSSDYLSLNNVTVGYTIPAKTTKKLGLSKIRIYGSADNVYLLSAREGLDPRQSYTSSTTARYTPIRTVSGGINVTF